MTFKKKLILHMASKCLFRFLCWSFMIVCFRIWISMSPFWIQQGKSGFLMIEKRDIHSRHTWQKEHNIISNSICANSGAECLAIRVAHIVVWYNINTTPWMTPTAWLFRKCISKSTNLSEWYCSSWIGRSSQWRTCNNEVTHYEQLHV